MHNIENIINDIDSVETLSLEKSFHYAQICSGLLKSEDKEVEGRKILINILNNWYKLEKGTIELWSDLIEAAGFYPYLQKIKDKISFKSLPGQIRKELHESDFLKSKYFHEDQFEVLRLLRTDKNVIVSAPTSFGKSLLIEEVVASKYYKNVSIPKIETV